MPAASRTATVEPVIPEDELEQHRIRLEQTLQHNDISLHLSSLPEDLSDVELPRHNLASATFLGFTSFDQYPRDYLDPTDENSSYHGWSYRTADEDEGAITYEGRTVSTAAHHASALTLSAGLDGCASRRDVSFSGAEYDADRPLQGIIAGFGSHIPGLDECSTKSVQFVRARF